MTRLPVPEAGDEATWVRAHLADLVDGDVRGSRCIRGGQVAADVALEMAPVTGYAARRNEVWPPSRRGATRLSPYIRHGLLTLPRVWAHASGAPPRDVAKLRDELLWQEYARHLYARTGGLARSLRHDVAERSEVGADVVDGWRDMACLGLVLDELELDGWLVNQTRMWFASHWTVREELGWRDGEDFFFRRLLDGSRAANRLGWQWTVGAATGRPYGFSRQQVERRAADLCRGCALRRACPIQQWPDERDPAPLPEQAGVRRHLDLATTAGPSIPLLVGEPEAVWLTAESLGDDDPALAAHPDLPAVFVWDEPLLSRLRLRGPRLVFLAECLADLATRREVVVLRGVVAHELAGRRLAATFAPVPGWRRRSAAMDVVAVHPWPWLVRPHGGPAGSFSAWRRSARVPGGDD